MSQSVCAVHQSIPVQHRELRNTINIKTKQRQRQRQRQQTQPTDTCKMTRSKASNSGVRADEKRDGTETGHVRMPMTTALCDDANDVGDSGDATRKPAQAHPNKTHAEGQYGTHEQTQSQKQHEQQLKSASSSVSSTEISTDEDELSDEGAHSFNKNEVMTDDGQTRTESKRQPEATGQTETRNGEQESPPPQPTGRVYGATASTSTIDTRAVRIPNSPKAHNSSAEEDRDFKSEADASVHVIDTTNSSTTDPRPIELLPGATAVAATTMGKLFASLSSDPQSSTAASGGERDTKDTSGTTRSGATQSPEKGMGDSGANIATTMGSDADAGKGARDGTNTDADTDADTVTDKDTDALVGQSVKVQGKHKNEHQQKQKQKQSRQMSSGEDSEEVSNDLLPPDAVSDLVIKVAMATVCLWLILLVTVYSTAAPESIVYLEGKEQSAVMFAFCSLFIAILLTVIPYFVGMPMKQVSGILVAAITVQTIAMCTNGIMAFGPTVVMFDRVTNSRVYLTRWCEWGPLAGFMTLLSETVDLSADPRQRRGQYTSAFLQFTSAICGLFLPMCPDLFSWVVVMTISCVTYFLIFPRIWFRWRRLQRFRASQNQNARSNEIEDRLIFSFRLVFFCGFFWTFLVVVYFVNMVIHLVAEPGHPWRVDGLAMISDTLFDLAAKIVYMKIIDTVHNAVFDAGGQVRRRLQELRHMLHVLWESSSDSIVISVASGPNQVSTMISPTFLNLIGFSETKARSALVIETTVLSQQEQEEQQQLKPGRNDESTIGEDKPMRPAKTLVAMKAYFVSMAVPFDEHGIKDTVKVDLKEHLVVEAMEIINATWQWKSGSPTVLHDVITYSRRMAKCEIKITQDTEDAVIGIVRDNTEQYLLGEAEQRAVMESQARQKDAQAVNRFTRHEVKNGLLAGIELCDCLKSSLNQARLSESGANLKLPEVDGTSTTESSLSKPPFGLFNKRIDEMDWVLHEILDTVMAEAMARDVIHGVYRPKLERLNVMHTLETSVIDGGSSNRFKVVNNSDENSFFLLDSQLLKYIHRNAVSNACKYGQEGGLVTTSVSFDRETQEFLLQVSNLPGPSHDELVSMGPEATEGVFKQGRRLHAELQMGKPIVSSGDGAWIMNKCAKTLKGECSISFSSDHTTFTFRCPSKEFTELDDTLRPWGKPSNFTVPEGTWAIAVDDSLIQRKLLGKLFENAGVPKDHCLLLGKTSQEIRGFGGTVKRLLNEDPECKMLILMDENLDMTENGRDVLLSGSRALHEMLLELDPSEERRILALIRSANDSGEDVEVYTNRSHGFFPKTPMKRDRVREMLSLLWIRRFHNDTEDASTMTEQEEILRKDVAKALFLCSSLISDGVTISRWPKICNALWDLKTKLEHDLLSRRVHSMAELIGGMQKSGVPGNFDVKWKLIRETVDDAVLKNW